MGDVRLISATFMMFLFLFSLLFIISHSETTRVFQLLHSFDGCEFTSRGTLEVFFFEDGLSEPSVAFEDTIFSSEDVLKWKESVLSGGYYTLRLHDPKTKKNLETSTRSCYLSKNSREGLTVHSDRSGNLVGLTYTTTRDM